MLRFEDLLGQDLPPAELRHKVVVSLLAVLELARLRVIRILQQTETGSFFLAQTDNADLEGARHLQVTSAKGSEPETSEAAGNDANTTSAPANESPAAETASLPTDAATLSQDAQDAQDTEDSEDAGDETDDESVAEDTALAEPRSPLEEGATAAVIASAEDAAAEADQAAAEAEEAFPEEPEADASAPESSPLAEADASAPESSPLAETDASAPESSPLAETAPDTTAPEADASAPDGTVPPLETAPASGSTDAQALPEQVADDSVRQGQQDGVISAPFPAPAPAGEELINGQTQEEQETSEK
jgi:hypothetical protein